MGFSAEQKADIWRRWKAGESLHEIGRAEFSTTFFRDAAASVNFFLRILNIQLCILWAEQSLWPSYHRPTVFATARKSNLSIFGGRTDADEKVAFSIPIQHIWVAAHALMGPG